MILISNRRHVMCLGKISVGGKIRMRRLQLPDDIEQRLLEGQHARATQALMERYSISLDHARRVPPWKISSCRPTRMPDKSSPLLMTSARRAAD
jgi:hypothetical protein